MKTAEVATVIGVSKATLLRWIAQGKIPDVSRDVRGWRVWSSDAVRKLKRFVEEYHGKVPSSGPTAMDAQAMKNRAISLVTYRRVFDGQGIIRTENSS